MSSRDLGFFCCGSMFMSRMLEGGFESMNEDSRIMLELS